MNQTIKQTASGFEVLKGTPNDFYKIARENPARIAQEGPVFILKTPDGINEEDLDQLKNKINTWLSQGARIDFDEGGVLEFLEVKSPEDAVKISDAFGIAEANAHRLQGSPRTVERIFKDKDQDEVSQRRKIDAETAKKFQIPGNKLFGDFYTEKLIQAKENLIAEVLRQHLKREPGTQDFKNVDLYERQGRFDLTLLAYCGNVLGGIKTNLLTDAPGWTFDPGIINFK